MATLAGVRGSAAQTAEEDPEVFRRLVAEGYDRCAEAYLAAEHASLDGDPGDLRLEPWARVAEALPEEGAYVLDVGCGSGAVCRLALRHPAKKIHMTGVDVSRRQIELARELFAGGKGGGDCSGGSGDKDSREQPSLRATFVCGDIMAMDTLPSPSATFDAIVAFFSVFHVPRRDHAALFKRVADWLKPGGVFVFNLGAANDDRGDGEGEASYAADWLGVPMVWSSWGRAVTVQLLTSAGLAVEEDVVRTVAAGDAVDDAGMAFRFFYCRKPRRAGEDMPSL